MATYMRENIIREFHSGGLGGNFGRDNTLALVEEKYFWSKMKSEVRKFVRRCKVCHLSKARS